MRRADGLYDISRREFCVLTGGIAGLAIAGCTDGGTGPIQTGGLGGDQSPDAGGHHDASPDGSNINDGSTTAACTGSPTDVGAPATFTSNTPKYFSAGNFFVVRDSGGLYALTAKCTHEGTTCVVKNSDFYCPHHGALFTFDGAVISGPVFIALAHYSMCVMSNGHVGVTTSMTVPQATRLDA